jgi:hypothetical protein
MDSVIVKSMLVVASLQAATAITASQASREAFVAATAIGVLAFARYSSLAFYAVSMGPGAKGALRGFALFAWAIGLLALGAAIAAVAVKVRPALPWAAAAALVGPFGMSALALVTGLGRLAGPRLGHSGGKR